MAIRDEGTLQAGDMRFLARSKRVQDKVLGVGTIMQKAINYRQKCELRMERMPHKRIPKQIMKYTSQGEANPLTAHGKRWMEL
jgi:hypothetical protein